MCNPNIIAVGHDSVRAWTSRPSEQFIARTYDIVLVCMYKPLEPLFVNLFLIIIFIVVAVGKSI